MQKLKKNSREYAAANILPLTTKLHAYGWDVRANGWHVATKSNDGLITIDEDMGIYSGKINAVIASAK